MISPAPKSYHQSAQLSFLRWDLRGGGLSHSSIRASAILESQERVKKSSPGSICNWLHYDALIKVWIFTQTNATTFIPTSRYPCFAEYHVKRFVFKCFALQKLPIAWTTQTSKGSQHVTIIPPKHNKHSDILSWKVTSVGWKLDAPSQRNGNFMQHQVVTAL